MRFGINKQYIFSKTNKIAQARGASAVFGLLKYSQVLIYSKLQEKNLWLCINNTHKKKYEIAYHNYAEAKRARQVQK